PEDEFGARRQRERALGHLSEHRERRLLQGKTDVLDPRPAIDGLLGGAHDARKREVHPGDDVGEFGVLAVTGGAFSCRAAGMRLVDVAGELVGWIPYSRIHRLAEHAIAAVPER